MPTDQTAVLRRILTELRAIRLRVDGQIASIQRVLRPPSGRPKASAGSKKKRRVAKPASKTKTTSSRRRRTVGYVSDRQALAARLARKKTG